MWYKVNYTFLVLIIPWICYHKWCFLLLAWCCLPMYHLLVLDAISWNAMFTRRNLLVLCDRGRKIYVRRKLSNGSLRIIVHNCKGNFNKFRVKALKHIYCRNGLDHTIVPYNQRSSLTSFSNAYSQLWQWYWYYHMCCNIVLRALYIYIMYATQEKQANK